MVEPARSCRSCGHPGLERFLSLGETPLADALLSKDELSRPEPTFPLDVAFCPRCSLVQLLHEVPPARLFVDNYLYFSSFSDDLLAHAPAHAHHLIESHHLGGDSLVVEIASNDGYLLKNFADKGIPVLGIDPAPDQAAAAEAAGIPTLREFFGAELATHLVRRYGPADVVVANNVMAHVPDLNGFVEGLRRLVAPSGVITVENPYVRDLVDGIQFDTIYHEHLCYFSCTAVDALLRRHGLYLNHVEHFPDLHGGSLRWWVGHRHEASETVGRYLRAEAEVGLTDARYYRDFAARVEATTEQLRELLHRLRAGGRTIAAYGAAAKGATLLNVAGIGHLLEFVVDRNVHKQGRYLPGAHLPIRDPSVLLTERPDYVLLLAWNFRDEVLRQQAEYTRRGGRFIIPVPSAHIVP